MKYDKDEMWIKRILLEDKITKLLQEFERDTEKKVKKITPNRAYNDDIFIKLIIEM